jgi:hypothetical protein
VQENTEKTTSKAAVGLAFPGQIGIFSRVNTASENLPHHLDVLKEKLQHPTDYELALHYFLEEFAGDVKFMSQSEPEDAPHLKAVLTHVAEKALGNPATLTEFKVFRLAQLGFNHGNAQIGQRVLLFFHFEVLDVGLAAFIPGIRGAMEVARFKMTGALAGNPKRN